MGLITGIFAVKLGIPMLILFIILLTVVIIAGRILGQLNKSPATCKEDEHIDTAHNLVVWIVTIASIAAGLLLLGLIALVLMVFLAPV